MVVMYLCILNIERAKNFEGNFQVNELHKHISLQCWPLYSKDLRWKAIFVAKILDLELKQVRNKFMQFIYVHGAAHIYTIC